jgi:hypothetical protein
MLSTLLDLKEAPWCVLDVFRLFGSGSGVYLQTCSAAPPAEAM